MQNEDMTSGQEPEEGNVNIAFYIPKEQTIPTQLRIRVDNEIDVYYERLKDAFGFKFEFFKHQGVTMEMATEIVNEIVSRMVSQSYDHGAHWRECCVREIENAEFELSITVFFRVRDAG
ncbi:hypothetical protein [Intestinibacillus massiliensis]|uniref:hypothetical protein n=1 Tax=Intestinibacillus massiliensis TaxID=1871029 RepID=UPI000B357F90|nr:hypothetical protein [Intestinibacillus massiliensis]